MTCGDARRLHRHHDDHEGMMGDFGQLRLALVAPDTWTAGNLQPDGIGPGRLVNLTGRAASRLGTVADRQKQRVVNFFTICSPRETRERTSCGQPCRNAARPGGEAWCLAPRRCGFRREKSSKGARGSRARSDLAAPWMVGHVRNANILPLLLAVSVGRHP